MPVAGALARPSPSPHAMVTSAWIHRRLILRLARREVAGRYRGTVAGALWSVLTPLLTVATYSFVFTQVFQPRWQLPEGAQVSIPLLLFSGVLLFGLFAEVVSRAPGLVLENVSYVKKVVFPLEILPWVSLLSALFNLGVGLSLMLAVYAVQFGPPPASVVLLPLVLLPLVLLSLGLGWLLAALGVYLRDLKLAVGILTGLLMFLSPIFYPVSALGEKARPFIMANPLTPVLEASKDVLFWGRFPDGTLLAVGLAVSLAVAWLGWACFQKLRGGFADVV